MNVLKQHQIWALRLMQRHADGGHPPAATRISDVHQPDGAALREGIDA